MGGDTSGFHEIDKNVFPIKTNIFEKNKIHCISVHMDAESNPKINQSSFWANGKLIKEFTSRSMTSGTSQLLFGSDSSKNIFIFRGEIFFTSILTERKMKEKEIALNHYLLCKKFEIDFDEQEVVKYI